MNDIYKGLKGYFKIESIKDGEVIDVHEKDNLIMDEARLNMAVFTAGVTGHSSINKFVLGTEGHNVDILIPKTGTEGFVKERTELFSEEQAEYNYPIEFTPSGLASGAATIDSEPDSGSTVSILQNSTAVTYTIDIPVEAANYGATTVFTEAALYAGDYIFSMKTFKAKIKDDSVSLRVTWTISF